MADGLLVSFTILLFILPLSISDPCLDGNHVSIDKGKYRGTECEYRLGKSISDRYINDGLWYKAEGPSGTPLSMPTSPVAEQRCSTKLPIWMNGTHPAAGLTTNHTACVSGPTSTCETEYTIEVKNCRGFYLYKLEQARSLETAYCFGDGHPCPPTDPCVDIDRSEMADDGFRSAACSPIDRCDDTIGNGWYRVHAAGDENVGLQMADQCPKSNHCGARFPIWMEGAHPIVSDGIVTRNVCVRNDTDCCGERFPINVVNCNAFYVYELKNRTTCPERYCFGNLDYNMDCSDTSVEGNNGAQINGHKVLDVKLIAMLILTWLCSVGPLW